MVWVIVVGVTEVTSDGGGDDNDNIGSSVDDGNDRGRFGSNGND